MKFSLSTNWCNLRIEHGEEIVAAAERLGFEELELGFHTTAAQAEEIVRCGRLPVGSIHAFCPVPLSAPQGYPELYALADFDEAARALARVHVKKNIEFAASVGADAVVLHAGRVFCRTLFKKNRLRKRIRRGAKLIDLFRAELDALRPTLEANKVTLTLENLPYLEGFPAEWELKEVVGDWVKPWLDTGHDYVRQSFLAPQGKSDRPTVTTHVADPYGLHLNDSLGGDDHLPPGEGKVDFSALRDVALAAHHLVFEPHAGVTEEALGAGLEHLRGLWQKKESVGRR